MAKRTWILLVALAGTVAAQEAPKARGYLGVRIAPIDPETRAAYSIPEGITEGVIIIDAMPEAPAAKAGLKEGDVLVKFAGAPVRTPEDLIELVRARAPGEEVKYVLRRGDGTIDGTLKLAPLPEASEAPAAPTDPGIEGRLDRVQRDIEELHRRLQRGPRTIEDWRRREEQRLAEARERRNPEAAHKAEIRIELLREMEEEGVRGLEERVSRIEKKLDEILARLGER